MNTLVFSEQVTVAFELLSKARELGTASASVLGADSAAKANDFAQYGAQKIFVGEDTRLADFHADVYADALAQIVDASGATTILIGSTKRGKELAGRLAQKLGCGVVTDASALDMVDGKLQAQRYALGGNTIATDVVTSARQVVAVLPKTFEATKQPPSATLRTGETVRIDLKLRDARVKIVERKPKAAATANLESAETLVVVGKGFAKQEDLALADAFARALKGEVGCTRTLASDYHWLGEERIIGISGKKCKPRLMVSLGVSGQIQHTVGILGSKLIVAINKDKAAPIFKIADYGIVGDLYQVLPKLTAKVQ
ncbi:MAG: electron transfer flavoprotein subunit alpha/FixB family protein [Chloroflexota bacterium]|nr:electron transfer flavoprotein subunit alpha/FixB family protein [Chloroflexota bacterium]